ncbi:MAG TPA: protein kinase [Acidobacteriaceae bacterium]
MPFQIGQHVGDYEIVQLLGAGGMGHVYRVRNIISNRTEAMKVLLPDLTAEPDLAKRFIGEIRTLASFDHPNIAQLHTAFQFENQLIMMMELVEGYTLEQIAGQRTMPVAEVSGYVSQALSALAYAHSRGVVHRDIKPANLMVTSHGILKLMDFGIAKSTGENATNTTKPGTTIGSLYYMSPEQVRGGTVDARSDIYSMGIVLYELLAGRRPFEADTTFSILNQQLNVLPQPPIEINPSLSPRMNEIILTALAKDPAARFQDADAFRAALKSFCLAPSGQEVVEPLYATPAAANIPAPAPPQAFQAAPAPPAYAPVPQNYMAPPQQQRKSGNKPLWIATGAVAAIIALVALGYGVPHWMKTHAASDASHPAETVVNAPAPAPAPTVDPAAANTIPETPAPAPPTVVTNPPATTPAVTPAPSRTAYPSPAPSTRSNPPAPRNIHPTNTVAQPATSAPAPQPAASNADVEEAQDRLIQINARATAARRSIDQIRSQQEAQGLGMRSDIEAAEARLDGYLRQAGTAAAHGNGPAASRDLDKADTELNTLEKFLGH